MHIRSILLATAAIAALAFPAFASSVGPPTHDPGFGLHQSNIDPMLLPGTAGDYQSVNYFDDSILQAVLLTPGGENGGDEPAPKEEPAPKDDLTLPFGRGLTAHLIGGAIFKV